MDNTKHAYNEAFIKEIKSTEFQNFLIDNKVFDAKQFLEDILVTAKQLQISERIYKDACAQMKNNNSRQVKIFEHTHHGYSFLIMHVKNHICMIGQVFDCVLQILNTLIAIGLDYSAVKYSDIKNKLEKLGLVQIKNELEKLWSNSKTTYYIDLYNYSKHVQNIAVSESLLSWAQYNHEVKIKNFAYKNNNYQEKLFIAEIAEDFRDNTLFEIFTFINYLIQEVKQRTPIINRFHCFAEREIEDLEKSKANGNNLTPKSFDGEKGSFPTIIWKTMLKSDGNYYISEVKVMHDEIGCPHNGDKVYLMIVDFDENKKSISEFRNIQKKNSIEINVYDRSNLLIGKIISKNNNTFLLRYTEFEYVKLTNI